jgi:hypothetical protein
VFHGAATEDAASCWKADQISLIRASTMPAIRGIRVNIVYDRAPDLFAAHIWIAMVSILSRRLVAQTQPQ